MQHLRRCRVLIIGTLCLAIAGCGGVVDDLAGDGTEAVETASSTPESSSTSSGSGSDDLDGSADSAPEPTTGSDPAEDAPASPTSSEAGEAEPSPSGQGDDGAGEPVEPGGFLDEFSQDMMTSTYDRDDLIDELIESGLTEEQAVCIVDGIEENFDVERLESQDDLTPEEEEIVIDITTDCVVLGAGPDQSGGFEMPDMSGASGDFDRDAFVAELIGAGFTEAQATCAADGVEESIGAGLLDFSDGLSAAEEDLLVEIGISCALAA